MQGVTLEPDEVDRYIKAHPLSGLQTRRNQAALNFLQVKSAAGKAQVDAELSSTVRTSEKLPGRSILQSKSQPRVRRIVPSP